MELWTRHGPLLHADGTVTFRVWAPRAERVGLALAGEVHPMAARPGGWFALRSPARHGSRYAFHLDDGDALPDPASRWQPDGVHQPSAVVDPSTFAWSDAHRRWRGAPVAGAVLYELHLGTFTAEGTLAAAERELDDLVALGVTHVEVMPVGAFDGPFGWGYDGVLWRAVDADYGPDDPEGSPRAFARFVDACHRRGLAVVLDVVLNHLGPSGNYLAEFGPYVRADRASPWGEALNLDGPSSGPVRAFLRETALGWLADYGVDALRLDAVHALVDESATHLLAELADATAALGAREGRTLALIAESDRCDPATVLERSAGGWAGRGVGRRPAPRDPHRADRRARGLLRRLPRVRGRRRWRGARLRVRRARGTRRSATRHPARRCPTSCRGGASSAAPRTTTRSATAPAASGWRRWSTRRACASRSRCWPARRTRRCCSWARSGTSAAPSCSSPATPTPTWPRRRAAAAARSSRGSRGSRPRTCPTRPSPRPAQRRA